MNEEEDATYLCLWCGRLIYGEPVYDADGECQCHVFIHDDVEHPSDATFAEDNNPQ